MRIRRRLGAVALAAAVAVAAPACGGDDGPGTPAASEPAPVGTSSTTVTTASPMTPEEEVEAAYLRSWEVYAKAVRDLDPSGLEESYAGDALELVTEEVEDLAADGTPVVVQVEHDYTVQIVESEKALVRDEYVNRNYRIDRQTGEPLDDPDEPGTYLETYQLEKVSGTWKVARIVRESFQP